ncbi:MAG: GNAT family N-acetyltransferase [Candidatus Sedimenticola endophacoides]
MPEPDWHIRRADWERDLPRLRAIREAVFVREQQVPLDEEWDAADPGALHLLAELADGTPIGTVRLLPDGQIGRMAVVAPWRGRGVGGALLSAILEVIRDGDHPTPFLNAQLQAIPFYRRHGFRERGGVFLEAGIEHRRMEMPVDD